MLITDRSRLPDERAEAIVGQVRRAAEAGISLVQVREYDLAPRLLLDVVRRCVQSVRGTSTRVLVNDRLDVALAAGAHGVHLRSHSFAAGRVRDLAPVGFLVGRSVHSVQEARYVTAEGGLDYLLFGTVFETSSKPGRAAAGVEILYQVTHSTPLPVLAVGGVTAERLPGLHASGAAGVAAIGLFTDPSRERVAGLRAQWSS
jgi:thiamine-phosphate pyrophosphorylase